VGPALDGGPGAARERMRRLTHTLSQRASAASRRLGALRVSSPGAAARAQRLGPSPQTVVLATLTAILFAAGAACLLAGRGLSPRSGGSGGGKGTPNLFGATSPGSEEEEDGGRPYHVFLFFCGFLTLLLLLWDLMTAKLGAIASRAIARYDRKYLGTAGVELGKLTCSPWRGRIRVRNVVVTNLKPFQSDFLFKAASAEIHVNVGRLIRSLGSEVEVTLLKLIDVDAMVEFDSLAPWHSNVQAILECLGDRRPSEMHAESPESTEEEFDDGSHFVAIDLEGRASDGSPIFREHSMPPSHFSKGTAAFGPRQTGGLDAGDRVASSVRGVDGACFSLSRQVAVREVRIENLGWRVVNAQQPSEKQLQGSAAVPKKAVAESVGSMLPCSERTHIGNFSFENFSQEMETGHPVDIAYLLVKILARAVAASPAHTKESCWPSSSAREAFVHLP